MDSISIQSMDITSLKAVLVDLKNDLIPSRFERAQQPERRTIQLCFRSVKGLTWLELSWDANTPRLVEIPSPGKQGRESTLAKQIQHSLKYLTLIEINQKGFERIVEFRFSTRPKGTIKRTLILEIMGRHSNFILLDEVRHVIAIGRQIKNNQSRVRPISTGDLYLQPPSLQGIKATTEESFKSWKDRICLRSSNLKDAISYSYQGISPSLLLQIANDDSEEAKRLLNCSVRNISSTSWTQIFTRWQYWIKSFEQNKFHFSFTGPTPYRVWNSNFHKGSCCKGISLKLGEYYKKEINIQSLNKLNKETKEILDSLNSIEERKIQQQNQLLESAYESELIQKKADQLLCIKFPSKEIIMKAQNLYKKAKKLRRSISIINERISFHKERLEIIETSGSFLKDIQTSSLEEPSKKLLMLKELQRELDDLLSIRKLNKHKEIKQRDKSFSFLEILTPNGIAIQIGRNHKQNELISFSLKRKGDIWFHAQECPGSHVILKSSKKLATEEDIQMAIDLASFFSRGRGNKQVAVIMVEAEKIKRLSGSIAGTVIFKDAKVCWGNPSFGKNHFEAFQSK